jgi:hypothetical protein
MCLVWLIKQGVAACRQSFLKKSFFMDDYTLKLEAPWDEVKEMLEEIDVNLTDEDLRYEKGKEKELLERLSRKLNKSIPETKAWIESVSHNKGLAY